MTFHGFNEARANFEAQRKEQAAIAAQALEMRLLQRDFIKVTSDLKIALERLEADRVAAAAPPPAKPATKPTEAKAAVPAPKAAPKPRPKPLRKIDDLEQSLAVIAGKITALTSRLSKISH